ncbi:Cytochrome P450 714A1, partial [Linum perenne]
REVVKEVQLGKLIDPKITNITIDTTLLHKDPEIGGEDAHLFNPERFSKEVAKAMKNNLSVFLSFGITCHQIRYCCCRLVAPQQYNVVV